MTRIVMLKTLVDGTNERITRVKRLLQSENSVQLPLEARRLLYKEKRLLEQLATIRASRLKFAEKHGEPDWIGLRSAGLGNWAGI